MKAARLDFMGQLFAGLVELVKPEHADRATVLSQSLANQIDRCIADAFAQGQAVEAARAASAEADREIEQLRAEQEQSFVDILDTFVQMKPEQTH